MNDFFFSFKIFVYAAFLQKINTGSQCLLHARYNAEYIPCTNSLSLHPFDEYYYLHLHFIDKRCQWVTSHGLQGQNYFNNMTKMLFSIFTVLTSALVVEKQ